MSVGDAAMDGTNFDYIDFSLRKRGRFYSLINLINHF